MPPKVLDMERQDGVLAVRLRGDLESLHAGSYGEMLNDLLPQFDEEAYLRVVIDTSELTAAGSTVVAFFVLLWRQIIAREGIMVLSSVSEKLDEALRFSKVETAWPRYPSCAEGVAALRARLPEPTAALAEPATAEPAEILLVEDNPGEARLVQEALKEAKLPNRVHVVSDGEAAMAFLHRQGAFSQAPRPDLVLLDLNLPKKGGHEVLAEIRRDEALKSVPVIVLTSSEAEEDIVRSYNLNANAYMIKPALLDKFIELLQSLNQYWFRRATLPPK